MRRAPQNMARGGGVRFSGPVTLRRGVVRTIEGKAYRHGETYAPDDPGVLARPHFFILATPPRAERLRRPPVAPEPPPEEERDEPLGEAGERPTHDA